MNTNHLIIILTGKTASGKDTVMSELLTKLPSFKKILTTTSRLPRSNEKDGIDYRFIPVASFKQMIDSRELIEHVEYGGNLYGTQKSEILNNLNSDLIWRIDPSRAGEVRKFIRRFFNQDIASDLLKRILVVYLTVDDTVVLQRLTERGLSQTEIEKRMQEDKFYWQKYHQNYDYVVENVPGQLENTVWQIINIIKSHDGI